MQLPQCIKNQTLPFLSYSDKLNECYASPFYCFPVHFTASSVPICNSSLYSLHVKQTREHRQPSQHGQPLTFMLEKVLTDAVDTFRMRTQGNLSLIGNLLVIKEEEEVCVCSCSIIHLQKTKDPTRFSEKASLSNTINRMFFLSQTKTEHQRQQGAYSARSVRSVWLL